MNTIDIYNAIEELNADIARCIVENKEIPKPLRMQHNKLLNDYNEAWKIETSKSSKK